MGKKDNSQQESPPATGAIKREKIDRLDSHRLIYGTYCRDKLCSIAIAFSIRWLSFYLETKGRTETEERGAGEVGEEGRKRRRTGRKLRSG